MPKKTMGTDTTQVGKMTQTSLGVKIKIRAKGNTNIGCKAMLMGTITGTTRATKAKILKHECWGYCEEDYGRPSLVSCRCEKYLLATHFMEKQFGKFASAHN